MALEDKFRSDLKEAMRRGDVVRRSVIRMVLANIKSAEIERGVPLDDAAIIGVIEKDIKRHQDSIEAFSKANRQDLVSKEREELEILQGYMPARISHEEVIEAARRVIEEVGAGGPRDKGKVMSPLIAELKGKADGQEINTVVSELLAGLSGN